MTREEILSMPAGPAMDAEVATRLMGWTRRAARGATVYEWPGFRAGGTLPDMPALAVPPYSKDWSAAGEVVDALRLRGIYLSLHARPSGYSAEAWGPDGERLLNLAGRGDTAPLATSRASLLTTLATP